jgi:hypothetical protein
LRYQLHPRAYAGGAGAHPHQAEIAVLKRPKDPVQQQCGLISGQRFLSFDQVDQIAVAIFEKDKPVTLVFIRRAEKFNAFAPQLGVGLVKIRDRDRNVA